MILFLNTVLAKWLVDAECQCWTSLDFPLSIENLTLLENKTAARFFCSQAGLLMLG